MCNYNDNLQFNRDSCVILYYNYSIKTDHSIVYIVLINTYYHRFINNRTLSILNHHKNSGVGKSWNFDNIGKIITNSSYHQKCRKLLPSFQNNHSWFFSVVLFIIYCPFRVLPWRSGKRDRLRARRVKVQFSLRAIVLSLENLNVIIRAIN